eukprot:gnl/MRDRNA2_/MRDRNA2_111182_c0_seq1.p1 gnl/MRDRNA2_/MRDRNA2_111182_c0~~gnl/MRDRNA2_/MRDRNA2_111182_c0_seq1.p1  ORF type:complete len:953 (-),score=220.29 gnl/MRDRNA2_/MRDRNA2_111182_c0_seq1:25-2568(-)
MKADRGGGYANGSGGSAVSQFKCAENLSVYSLSLPENTEFDVVVEKDGKQKLGVNVDHGDGKHGLLVRRIDPGLIENMNSQAEAAHKVQPGDRITRVNEVSGEASALAEEIQKAQKLHLHIQPAPVRNATVVTRYFVPNFSPLNWPILYWSSDEGHCFRLVSDEVLVLDGKTLVKQRSIKVQSISQMSVSPGVSFPSPSWGTLAPVAISVFCPASNSNPARLMVYTDVGKSRAQGKQLYRVAYPEGINLRTEAGVDSEKAGSLEFGDTFEACECISGFDGDGNACKWLKLLDDRGWAMDDSMVDPDEPSVQKLQVRAKQPAFTKSFFFSASWITTRWDPNSGTDVLILVHSSELSEADFEGRTLCGQGGSGLYLLRTEETSEPIATLSSSQEGMIFDVQWRPCRDQNVSERCFCVLQGPQPAHVSIYTYRGGRSPNKEDIGRFGIRNSLVWDGFGRSLCIRARPMGGTCTEADSLDLFDAPFGGEVRLRVGGATINRKSREPTPGVNTVISSAGFSPDGKVLLLTVGGTRIGEIASELKFLSAETGSVLWKLKFDEIFAARWRNPAACPYSEPDFPVPEVKEVKQEIISSHGVDVDLKDKDAIRKRVKALQKKLQEIEKLKSKPELDNLQQKKVSSEEEIRQVLKKLEDELANFDRPDRMVFDIETEHGMKQVELHEGDDCMEVAKGFLEENGLELELAKPLAERMEEQLRNNSSDTKRKGPEQQPVDMKDKEAVKRKVRALQKKLREIEKLKEHGCDNLDSLQKEKVSSEEEMRAVLKQLSKELDLLERPPRMVFDIETEDGVKYVDYRDGDDCLELAKAFVEENGLDPDLAGPLSQHMEQKLAAQ